MIIDSKQIINEILSVLGLTANSLAKNVGVSPQTIYDIINGKTGNSLSKNLTSKIIKVYPYINESFLLTGKGDIIIEKSCMGKSGKIEEVLDRMSLALLNNSEANKITAEAKLKSAEVDLKNAESMERITRNLDRVIELLDNQIRETK